jgi:hemerythrin-like domain-containing protein
MQKTIDGVIMLTLTYALVALKVEQTKLQGRLTGLQQRVQKERSKKVTFEQAKMESLLADFMLLDDACHSRNIELYVVPALRQATPEADKVLADMDTLTSMGRIVLRNVRNNLRKVATQSSDDINEFFDSLESYCQNMMNCLRAEETHLLPLAQRYISGDEWFDIAAKFISHESERQVKKSYDANKIGGERIPLPGTTLQSNNMVLAAS